MPNIGQQHSIEKSRQLQRNLYLAAKKDKQRRFHALYDRKESAGSGRRGMRTGKWQEFPCVEQ